MSADHLSTAQFGTATNDLVAAPATVPDDTLDNVGLTVDDLALTTAVDADTHETVLEAAAAKRFRLPFGLTGHDRASHAEFLAEGSVIVSGITLGTLFGLQAGGHRLHS